MSVKFKSSQYYTIVKISSLRAGRSVSPLVSDEQFWLWASLDVHSMRQTKEIKKKTMAKRSGSDKF